MPTQHTDEKALHKEYQETSLSAEKNLNVDNKVPETHRSNEEVKVKEKCLLCDFQAENKNEVAIHIKDNHGITVEKKHENLDVKFK